jgi:aspartate aminotransferase-like enzyme
MEARWQRHAMLRATVEQWVMVRNDLQVVPPVERRAAAATCLRLPPGSSAQRIVAGLADDDWPIGPDPVRGPEGQLCVGHMGDVTESELLRLLEAIGRQLDLGR